MTSRPTSKVTNKEMKMDWMYRDSSQVVDPEEYLLGRKVDKQFEKSTLPPDKDHDPLPTSIFSLSVIENQVDIARKLQEDPLYLIKKKEIESREQLLKNPRKIKQLQEMLARQQAAAEKLRRKQMKKDKKLKKNKDLDALLAKKCKTLLGGFDMKKLDALESDVSSDSSSNEPHKYKKKKKGEELDELLACKYKQLLGKVDPRKLIEMSSSSESDSSSGDKNTEKKKSKKDIISSENESSSDDQNKQKIKRETAEKQHCLQNDSSRLKRKGLKENSKVSRHKESSDEMVERNRNKSNYKNVKTKHRDSSSDSQVSHDDKKQKLHHSSKNYNRNRDFSGDTRGKHSHYERYKNKSSEQRNECHEGRSRHEKRKETSTHPRSSKSKKVYDKLNNKKSVTSNTDENRHKDSSDESSSSSSCNKQTNKKRGSVKSIKKVRKERSKSNSSSDESRGKKPKLYVKSRKSKENLKKAPLTSSNSDSDVSLSNKKINQKKQYGLVLPANYVPKKPSKTAPEKLPLEVKAEVKPFRREEKQKLTEEEKEKRLKEMMENAKWRDDLRDTNIKMYKKKQEAEKDNYVYNEDFMRNQMSYAMSQGTVESRVKAKINTIQRSKDAMSESFARRK